MITHLIFSGSNIYGLPYLGVIRYLYTNNKFVNIKNIAGTSFGSYMAYICAIKMPIEIYEEFMLNFCKDENLKLICASKTINLITKLGMENIYKYIEKSYPFLIEKYGTNKVTFIDIAKKNGINLHINAFCINTNSEFIFNIDNSPNVAIIDAVSASMALPFLYQPVEIDGFYYCDSCFITNTLINYFPNINKKNILSIFITKPINIEIIEKNTHISFLTYISIIIKKLYNIIFTFSSYQYNTDNSLIINNDLGIRIDITKKGILFHLNEHIFNIAILLGYNKTADYFNNYQSKGDMSELLSPEII
jgi:predicted patatin/cPLA2 family phospholipase